MKRDSRVWRKHDKVNKLLRPLQEKYAKAAVSIVAKHFDLSKPDQRLAAMSMANATELHVAFEVCSKDTK